MSERTIVCVRADHPVGYGYLDPDTPLRDIASGGYRGKAHGYVLLYVTHVEPTDVSEVVRWLETHDVREVFAPVWQKWYGGRFEPVAVFEGAPLEGGFTPYVNYDSLVGYNVCSLGDNRAYAVVTWAQLRWHEERTT